MTQRHIHDFEVMKSLENILEKADLTVLTRKKVRLQLEEQFGGSFESPEWKARIKEQIAQFVERRESAVDSQSDPHSAGTEPKNKNLLRNTARSSTADQPPPKRRRVATGDGDEAYFPPTHRGVYGKQSDTQYFAQHKRPNGQYSRPKLQSNKQLIQKSPKDNSYFITLPGGSSANKRCIIHRFKSRLYVGFREYYEKNGEQLPTKKGCNLSQEQWEFVVRNIDAINEQIKRMR